MNNLETNITNYLEYCRTQKCLDSKTLKAYRIDLNQFADQIPISDVIEITSQTLEETISILHQKYKPKTVKRKIATLKSFFHYLEYKDIIMKNPFAKIHDPTVVNLSPEALIYQAFRALFLYKKMKYFIKIT